MSFVSCLKIVDWTDMLHDFYSGFDGFDDLFRRLISHGAFIKGRCVSRSGENTIHLLPIFFDAEDFTGFLPAIQPSSAVRSGEVPVRISFAETDQTSVSHVQRNQELLPRLGRNSSFSDDSVAIDIVVNRFKHKAFLEDAIQAKPSEYRHQDVAAIPLCEKLTQPHIPQIIIHISAFEVTKVVWYRFSRRLLYGL